MVRLTNKIDAPIEEIGSPEDIMAALGPFVTGDSYEPEELVETGVRTVGGQTVRKSSLLQPLLFVSHHGIEMVCELVRYEVGGGCTV